MNIKKISNYTGNQFNIIKPVNLKYDTYNNKNNIKSMTNKEFNKIKEFKLDIIKKNENNDIITLNEFKSKYNFNKDKDYNKYNNNYYDKLFA